MLSGSTKALVGGTMALVAVAAALGEARPAAPSDCNGFAQARLGLYHRVYGRTWTLRLTPCTFEVRRRTRFEGGGRYFVTTGNDRSGQVVLQDDRGCRSADQRDLPTPYRYTFGGERLRLRVDGVHGIADDACTGRGHDLTVSPWVKER